MQGVSLQRGQLQQCNGTSNTCSVIARSLDKIRRAEQGRVEEDPNPVTRMFGSTAGGCGAAAIVAREGGRVSLVWRWM
jgi:hypothetical protein